MEVLKIIWGNRGGLEIGNKKSNKIMELTIFCAENAAKDGNLFPR